MDGIEETISWWVCCSDWMGFVSRDKEQGAESPICRNQRKQNMNGNAQGAMWDMEWRMGNGEWRMGNGE